MPPARVPGEPRRTTTVKKNAGVNEFRTQNPPIRLYDFPHFCSTQDNFKVTRHAGCRQISLSIPIPSMARKLMTMVLLSIRNVDAFLASSKVGVVFAALLAPRCNVAGISQSNYRKNFYPDVSMPLFDIKRWAIHVGILSK